ncbi:MAG: N-acetylmuramoyl-L-alanine amidase family protein [bacterium]
MYRSSPLIRPYAYIVLVFLMAFLFLSHIHHSVCLAENRGEELDFQGVDYQNFREEKDYHIVIDPGHGGSNYGVSELESDICEKELVLDLARRLKNLIQDHTHHRVSLTREKDINLSLVERTTFANHHKADLFLSIHVNAHFHPGLDEFQIIVASYSHEERKYLLKHTGEWMAGQLMHMDDSKYLAVCIEKAALKANICGSVKMLEMPLQVLRGAHMPAVLVEAGFLSNTGQRERSRSNEYRQRVAVALFEGISSYMTGTFDLQNNMDDGDYEEQIY